MKKHHRIGIVGGGPAGLSAALQLGSWAGTGCVHLFMNSIHWGDCC
jgi:thioredoxin reductase